MNFLKISLTIQFTRAIFTIYIIDNDEKSSHTEAFKRVRRVEADTGRLMKCISESERLNEVGFSGGSRYRAGVYQNPQSSGR